jgi:hypothetical protein
MIENLLPLKNGLSYHQSNKTPLGNSSGKYHFDCPICNTAFERYWCWAKRVNTNYCSRACSGEAKRIRFDKPCVVCNKIMSLTATYMSRVSTCCHDCLRINRTSKINKPNNRTGRGRSHIDYKKISERLKQNPVCSDCGVLDGPWSVQGIVTTINKKGIYEGDGSKARLVCRHCALTYSSKLGTEAILRKAQEK